MDGKRVPMQYSPGVLVGNWYEDMRVREDKVGLYKALFQTGDLQGTQKDTTLRLGETVCLDELHDVVVTGQPLQLVNVATGAALALDTAPLMSPTPHKFLVTATESPEPQIRSVWVIHRAKDENNVAYTQQLKEEQVLHYGQRVCIVNEDASLAGFCYLHSGVKDAGGSGEQLLTAAIGACSDNVFVLVRPGERRDDIRDGGPVLFGEPVALYHAATNRPVRCIKTRKRTSFGFEFEMNCSFACDNYSRSLGAVTSHPENLFLFVAGKPKSPAEMAALRSSSRFGMRSHSGHSEKLLLSMKSCMGLDLLMAQIREGALRLGGRLGFRTLSRALGTACNEKRTTLLDRQKIYEGLCLMGVEARPMELDVIFKRFDKNGDGFIVAQEFLCELRGEISPYRLDAVIKAFQQLTVEGEGSVDFKDMLNLFRLNASSHPDVEEAIVSCEEIIFDFINCWPGKNDTTTVTLDDFLAYYTDISPAIESDERFVTILQRCWAIPESNFYKTGWRSRRVVTVLHSDGKAEIIDIPDSLVIDMRDDVAVRRLLVQHGVKDIKEIQLQT